MKEPSLIFLSYVLSYFLMCTCFLSCVLFISRLGEELSTKKAGRWLFQLLTIQPA